MRYATARDRELEEFESLAKDNINEAKKRLAYKVTSLCHGQEKAQNAMETAMETVMETAMETTVET